MIIRILKVVLDIRNGINIYSTIQMSKEINRENLEQYNVYAGLGGGFGGAFYQFTTLAESEDDAMDEAYNAACEEYDSRAGMHGIRSYEEIAEDEDLDPNEDIEVIEEIYNQEREDWIDYYVVLTSEDDGIDKEDLILDYIIDDEEHSEG